MLIIFFLYRFYLCLNIPLNSCIADICFKSRRKRVPLPDLFRMNEQKLLFIRLFQFIHDHLIPGHMPFHMTENMLCTLQLFDTNRHQTNLFAVRCHFFLRQFSLFIREFIQSCQQSFPRPLPNGKFLAIFKNKYRSLLDPSCLRFLFYRNLRR